MTVILARKVIPDLGDLSQWLAEKIGEDSGAVEFAETQRISGLSASTAWARVERVGAAAGDCLSRQRLRRLRDSPRETLANLSITGHLRGFSDQPVAEIVQCGEPISSFSSIRQYVERLNVSR